MRLFRDCSPREPLDRTPTPGFAETLAQLRVDHQLVNPRGKVSGELIGAEWLEGTFAHLLERDKVAGLPGNHDFLDATDSARNNCCFARHCFEVDDAEGF